MARRRLNWILGFGAEEISPLKLTVRLPTFVELVFLREADQEGSLEAYPSSIRHSHPGKSRFLESVQDSFCYQTLLADTSIIAMNQPRGHKIPLIRELVFSSQMSMWGIPLPECPTCGNHQVRANSGKVNRGKSNFVTLKCHGCGATTKGKGVQRPPGVEEIPGSSSQDVGYYWKQMEVKSPWSGHTWRVPGHDSDNHI
jgi:hypothetical protein